jgi:hypothetical protein
MAITHRNHQAQPNCVLPSQPQSKSINFQNHAQPSQSSSPTNSSYHRAAARTEKKKKKICNKGRETQAK